MGRSDAFDVVVKNKLIQETTILLGILCRYNNHHSMNEIIDTNLTEMVKIGINLDPYF